MPSDIVIVPDESRITFTSSTNNLNAITQASDGTLNVQNDVDVGGVFKYDGYAGYKTVTLVVGNSSEVSTGGKEQTRVIVPFSGEIISWQIIVDTPSTLTLDVWKSDTIPTNSDSITGSAKPSLSDQQFATSSTLTGWTTSVSINDIFILEVESNNNATHITLTLMIRTYTLSA